MSTMNTYTGKQFDPMLMTEENVSLRDIAHALSLLCRGGGQVTYFYSVGQHSVNCAKEAKARGWSGRLVLACLLHDASEAYLSDIIRPVKEHLQGYREIESQIMQVIFEKFGLGDLTAEENRCWKQIDNEMLSNEMPAMLNGRMPIEKVKIYSEPDLAEHPFREVEEEFYSMAEELLSLRE